MPLTALFQPLLFFVRRSTCSCDCSTNKHCRAQLSSASPPAAQGIKRRPPRTSDRNSFEKLNSASPEGEISSSPCACRQRTVNEPAGTGVALFLELPNTPPRRSHLSACNRHRCARTIRQSTALPPHELSQRGSLVVDAAAVLRSVAASPLARRWRPPRRRARALALRPLPLVSASRSSLRRGRPLPKPSRPVLLRGRCVCGT
eukprot:SAG22_NODE_1453_length_4394_cov_29.832363_4_plen_203_part_00